MKVAFLDGTEVDVSRIDECQVLSNAAGKHWLRLRFDDGQQRDATRMGDIAAVACAAVALNKAKEHLQAAVHRAVHGGPRL
jgi:hypothetical protein